MSNIIFAIPRTEYGSYSDLYRLIQLNEYPTCYLDEIDPDSDNCYVMTVSNGENANGWQNPRADIRLWDFEWRIEDGSYPRIPGCSEYWHMDAAQARQHGVRYVPLGGDARLKLDTPPDDVVPDYDVAYMAYMTHRRQRVYDDLKQAGLRIADNSWGEERHQRLLKSKAYIHVHQNENAPGVPALRLVVAAAYGLPVISEMFADPGAFAGLALEYENVVEAVKRHAHGDATDQYLSRIASEALQDFLCKHYTFRRVIEQHV